MHFSNFGQINSQVLFEVICRHFKLITFASIAIACLCGPARAQQSAQQRAAALFEQGVELYQEGSLDSALIAFERAYEAVPDYRVLFNIAQVQAQRGYYVEATQLFRDYLAQGGQAIDANRKLEVEQEIERLSGRLAKLWVESNVEGAELTINGKIVGLLPLKEPVVINSGLCDLRVAKPGYEPAVHQLRVAGGDAPRVSVTLSLLETAPAPVQPALVAPGSRGTESPNAKPTYTPFWVALGATAALGAGAGTLGFLARTSEQKMNDELDNFPADRRLVNRQKDTTETLSAWADGAAIAAVVAAGVSVYLLASPPNGDPERPLTGIHSLKLVSDGRSAIVTGSF